MTYRGRSYQTWLLGGAAAVAMMQASAAAAQDTEFNIAPQPLASALNEFSVQSRQSVLFTTDLAQSKTSPGVTGEVEVADALSSILAGTGLTWRRQGDTFLVTRVDADPQSGSAAGDGAEGTVDALIVTAQKREEDIQDVPIAISAFTQEDLTRSQVAGGPDLITQVPNMTFTKTNFTSFSIQIRGIGTQAISATTDPAVAVAFNNTPFIRNHFFEQEFYDLQRVEVLRGPQGTLYGRNATAGVVNVISAKPKFNYEAKLSGDVSNFKSIRLEGMVNIPLVEDKVALRLAGAWTKRNGYATNEIDGDPIDGRDLWSTRVSLRFAPNERIDANLIWEHFEEDDDRLRSGKQLCKKHVITEVNGIEVDYFHPLPDNGQAADLISNVQSVFSQGCIRNSLYADDSFQTPNGMSIPYYYQLGTLGLPRALKDPYVSEVQSRDLRVIESIVDPEYRAIADLGELQVSFDLSDSLILQSETGYIADEIYSLQDFNRFNTAPGAWLQPTATGPYSTITTPGPNGGIFCDPQLGCSDRLVAVDIARAASRQFSQEFRLSSDFDGAFNFSLGANYLRYDTEDKYYVFINSLSMRAALSAITPWNDEDVQVYVPGETNGLPCLVDGRSPGDPNRVYPVAGCQYSDINPFGSLDDQGHNYFLSKNPYKLISYAMFGEAYYNITDSLKVTAGLRFSVDKKQAPRVPTWLLAGLSFGYPVAEVIEQEWREPTGRLVVDWKPDLTFTDETLLYASYAHGYKAGGANPPTFVFTRFGLEGSDIARQNSATRPTTFDPEFVDAFEIGAKNTLADGKVTLNFGAFYYDYEAYQISEIVDRSAFNRNFDATVWGVEIEADWRPLENLKLGFKGGYEKTRIADGEQAIDLMDRTAGTPGWSVVRPFPTYASSCVLPTWLYTPPGGAVNGGYPLFGLGGPNGGNPAGCEHAYLFNNDPVTQAPYVPNPTGSTGSLYQWQSGTYPGFNPLDESVFKHNHGEGFFKQLGGNELPNAPNWTATITGDYTLPLPNEWLATLHTDLHWQSESWWRVFNDHQYNRLDAYFTMNLAAIFTNEERGWNVMAYVKNVTDETAITGAFLNSDDTGLTTNVFLTEPRLYGLRVTKNFTGGPLLGSFGQRREGPYPFTVELGGQTPRWDAPNEALRPSFADEFAPAIDNFAAAQEQDLDRGDVREVKVTWRPAAGPWSLSATARVGRTNGRQPAFRSEQETEATCALGGYYAFLCSPDLDASFYASQTNFSDLVVVEHEEHTIVDFSIGRDFGFGVLDRSTISAGLRHAEFTSDISVETDGVPDWYFPAGWYLPGYPHTRTRYRSEFSADREFQGTGPVFSWDASKHLFGNDDAGHVNVDWSVGGGVLFGKTRSVIVGSGSESYYEISVYEDGFLVGAYPDQFWTPADTTAPTQEVNVSRSTSVRVPTANLSLGLSYRIDRVSVGAGYSWERYFDVLDGGFSTEGSYDRTIDGPYFKLSVGFGD